MGVALVLEVQPQVAPGFLRGHLQVRHLGRRRGGAGAAVRFDPVGAAAPHFDVGVGGVAPTTTAAGAGDQDDDPGDDEQADHAGADVGEHQPPLGLFGPRRLSLLTHLAEPLPLFLPAICHDWSAAV